MGVGPIIHSLPSPARRLLAAALVVLALLPGCGPARAPLQGTVSYDGAPIDNGTISFIPEGAEGPARPKAATRITNGQYAFEPNFGPFPGKYKVEITWDQKTGRRISTGDADSRDETKQILPSKYNTQTELTAEVKRGQTKLDFNLPK
jgi:hypothetical protein